MLSSAAFSLRSKSTSVFRPRHHPSTFIASSRQSTLSHARSSSSRIAQSSPKATFALSNFSSGSAVTRRFCASSATEVAAKPRFSFFQWKDATIARLRAKKAQVLVEYGSTFIFLHEFLGIASYGACFAIASSGLVTLDDIVSWIGVIPENIQQMITAKRDSLATTALTALVLLKCLDWLGLTPFRWFLAITLTPRIAWWLGPRIDSVVDSIKSRLPKRKAIPQVAADIVQPIPQVEPIVASTEQPKSL